MSSKGVIWVPAECTVDDGWLRVTTLDDTDKFRPKRLAWKESTKFTVTGLAEGHYIHRVSLRFQTPELASKAASLVKEIPEIVEEPLLPLEEVEIQARFLRTKRGLILLAYTFLTRLLVAAVFGYAFLVVLGLVGLIIVALLVLYVVLPLRPELAKRGKMGAFLRFEGKSLTIRTGSSWVPVNPKSMKWKDPTTLILGGSGLKVEISFLGLPTRSK